MQREYAEAYIASLVCCRPDGERKRSVRVVCVISIYLLGAPHGLCVNLRSLREKKIMPPRITSIGAY